MRETNKSYSNTHLRNTVYTEIGIGILANIILLLFHVSLNIMGHKTKPTDLPIDFLALIHLVMLVINGFIAADNFTSQGGRWDDLTCKLLLYLYRLMRVFSICTTCLLSVLQAITLSPRNSSLAKFKHKSLHLKLIFLLLLYVNSYFGTHLFISIITIHNLTSDNFMYVTEFFSLLPMSSFLRDTFAMLFTFREASLIGIITISNGFMVALLCRYRRQCQHLHSTSLSPISSPELRATQIILLLLSCFLVMSILDSIVSYARITLKHDPMLHCIQFLVAHSYASFSPFVFLSTEKRIFSVLRYTWGRTIHISLPSDG